MEKPVRIGLVAGEISGDILGGDLIRHLRQRYPQARFRGLGGEHMTSAGLESLFPLERLSVMGLVEPLKRLPELLRIRKALLQSFLSWRADVVVGIDAPDFNLGLEYRLRRRGVRTVHYVSPSVWAWRRGRIRKIAKAVDHMLTLFPFESEFYRQHQVPVTFVGHPLADRIPLDTDQAAARSRLGLPDGKLLAIMPGSRGAEIRHMCRLFLETAEGLLYNHPDLRFVIPAANGERHVEIREHLKAFPKLPVTLLEGQSQAVMAASDAVLLTSGTTALEAMLLKKPMVVAYRMGGSSYCLLSRLVKTPYIALPNLVAGRQLVPELIQAQATREQLVHHCSRQLFDDALRSRLEIEFNDLHQQLRCNASHSAAAAVAAVIEGRHGIA
jgi:lipid-A-disaccharide synthase